MPLTTLRIKCGASVPLTYEPRFKFSQAKQRDNLLDCAVRDCTVDGVSSEGPREDAGSDSGHAAGVAGEDTQLVLYLLLASLVHREFALSGEVILALHDRSQQLPAELTQLVEVTVFALTALLLQEQVEQAELPLMASETFDEFGEVTGVSRDKFLETLRLASADSPLTPTAPLDIVVRALACLVTVCRLREKSAKDALDVGFTLANEMRAEPT